MRIPFLVLSALLLASVSQNVQADDPKPGQQVAQVFQNPKTQGSLGYLLYLPENYGAANQKSPLLLFLHGAGERGKDIQLVKKHGPPKLIGQGQQMPFIVVSPQCPEQQRWEADMLLALLDDLSGKYAVDPAQVYVTGLSLGGFGTWSLVAAAPDRFAAAVPICGRADVATTVDPATKLPVWIIVGDKDNAQLVNNSLEMAAALQARNSDVKLTVMHGVGHDSWTQSYATPELYEWMLRHRKAK